MSSNVSKPGYSRSISVKPQKNAFEYENDGELTKIYFNYPIGELSRSTSSSKVSSKSQPKSIKYRKSSSRSNTLVNGNRSSSYHALTSNQISERTESAQNELHYRQAKINEKLQLISQQNFYLLNECIPGSFVVCGESSSRYIVNIGPQTCCCMTKSGTNTLTFPCVHLLFVMCKVLLVQETDPLLMATHLKKVEFDELFQRFNNRRKEKLKNPYRPNDKGMHNHNEEDHDAKSSRLARFKTKQDFHETHPTESLDEITCTICLQEMSIAQSLIFCQYCSNEFHSKCLLFWMKEKKNNNEPLTCPLCRKSWPSDDLSKDVVSPLEYGPVLSDENFFVPRSHSIATSFQHINHLEVTNMASSTSDLTSSNFSFNISGSRHNFSVTSNHKPIGYCFSAAVAEMLSSDMSDKREAGLRQVAEQTVQIVVSAGSAYSVEDGKMNDTIATDIVSSMGGHTTGLMLKEAFRVIAKLLDDTIYTLFVGALRAFREILGYLICRTENEVERMSRMISPVLCQLLRICGDSSQKKKAQMCLSALFELAKGQEGGMALGREIRKTSFAVTGWQRLAKFAISNHHRFKTVHCYGRLSLLERLLDKFDLTPDILRKLLEFVTSQLLLMHRSIHLSSSFDSGKIDILETTDVDTGLSTTDIRLLSGQRLQKLAKVLFINTAKLTMSKLKFNGWSSQDVYMELWKELNKLPQPWKEKFMIKLKIPWDTFIASESAEIEKPPLSSQSKEKKKPESSSLSTTPNIVSKSYRISKRCSQIKPVGAAAKISGMQSANSVNSLKLRAGNITQTIRSASSGSCRISPFIRITPEPAYDAVPLSESEDDMSNETSSAFFSELAIHNNIYGHPFGFQESNTDERNEEEEIIKTNTIFKKVLSEQINLKDTQNSLDMESQPPPGLGVFSTEYRSGYEWCQGMLLGTGAFSKCYQGRDVRTGLLMAVKQISISHSCIDKNEEIIKAVKTEVNLMIQLNHPNVLPLLGAVFSPTDNTISMFVRWMPGGSVASLLNQYSAFLEPVTLAYALQTARGLSYIHSNRILHRDLKGANLLLDSSGMRLRISDFGASARLSNGRDSNASDFKGQLLGTVAFMAPEVLRGEEYGRSCDVWSFACCIIEMLTGSQPWRDRNHTNHLALMYTIASAEEPPKLPEQISADLHELLTDCLNRDPKKRPLSSKLESFKVFKHLAT